MRGSVYSCQFSDPIHALRVRNVHDKNGALLISAYFSSTTMKHHTKGLVSQNHQPKCVQVHCSEPLENTSCIRQYTNLKLFLRSTMINGTITNKSDRDYNLQLLELD